MKKNEFVALAHQVSPTGFLDYRQWLDALYKLLKNSVASYSYSRFAADLGFSSSNVLHHVIKGRRPLTTAACLKIAGTLRLGNLETSYLKYLVAYNNSDNEIERHDTLQMLLDLQHRLVDDTAGRHRLEFFKKWYHPVIAELARLENFSSDPGWISRCLNQMVTEQEVAESLQLLERMGLIEWNAEKGTHQRTKADPSTGAQVTEISVASYHAQMIKKAGEALVRCDKVERIFHALTLVADESTLGKIETLLLDLQKQVVAIDATVKKPQQVFQLNVQFFPLSRSLKKAVERAS